jgi:hypothetical protein
MKNTLLPLALGALLMVGAGCGKTATAPGSTDGLNAAVRAEPAAPGAPDAAAPADAGAPGTGAPSPRTVAISLPAVSGSGEYGRAVLTAIASNQVRVVLTITGASKDEAQTAAIHSGPCSDLPAGVQYELAPLVKGRSETLLNVSMQALVDDVVQSIRIKRDSVDTQVPLATCGNLR